MVWISRPLGYIKEYSYRRQLHEYPELQVFLCWFSRKTKEIKVFSSSDDRNILRFQYTMSAVKLRRAGGCNHAIQACTREVGDLHRAPVHGEHTLIGFIALANRSLEDIC